MKPFIICVRTKQHIACKVECILCNRLLCTLKVKALQTFAHSLCAQTWEIKLPPEIYLTVSGDNRVHSCFQSWGRLLNTFPDD